jgi:adenylate cyclase class IV
MYNFKLFVICLLIEYCTYDTVLKVICQVSFYATLEMKGFNQVTKNKMVQELKIRINNLATVENKLKELGAIFVKEEPFVDTYFNQPPGLVLKIVTVEHFSNLIKLESTDGKFRIVSKTLVENAEQEKAELSAEFGIKSVLQGKRMFFELEDLKISISLIDELGQFLILTSENPTEDFISEKLGIKNPEYIRVSFDELTK